MRSIFVILVLIHTVSAICPPGLYGPDCNLLCKTTCDLCTVINETVYGLSCIPNSCHQVSGICSDRSCHDFDTQDSGYSCIKQISLLQRDCWYLQDDHWVNTHCQCQYCVSRKICAAHDEVVSNCYEWCFEDFQDHCKDEVAQTHTAILVAICILVVVCLCAYFTRRRWVLVSNYSQL